MLIHCFVITIREPCNRARSVRQTRDLCLVATHLLEALTKTVLQIDFRVMNGLLAFLLFGGALHVDLATLVSRAVPPIELATFATITSTFILGFLFWQPAGLLG